MFIRGLSSGVEALPPLETPTPTGGDVPSSAEDLPTPALTKGGGTLALLSGGGDSVAAFASNATAPSAPASSKCGS